MISLPADRLADAVGLSFAPEAAVLLCVARPTLDATARASLRAAVPGVADWTWLVQQALVHGVGVLLCRHLRAVAADLLPSEFLAAAAVYEQDRIAAAAAAVTELDAVVRALADASLRALPFKGPVLSVQAYGDPAARVFADLDLLIDPDAVTSALAALAQLGYRSSVANLPERRRRDYHRYNGQDALIAEGRMTLEPHWAFAPTTLSMDLATAPLWTRSIQLSVNGHSLSCLAPEDALLAACLHGGKEQWTRLIWIADVAALLRSVPALDWAAVLDRASAAGLRRMVLLGAHLAGAMLGAPLPEPVCAAVAADRSVRHLASHVGAALFTGDARTPTVFRLSAFRWTMRERWSDRLRYATRTLLTARVTHFRSVDLPGPLTFLYPAVRLGHDFVALPLWKALHRRRS